MPQGPIPDRPKIYHITHVENLEAIAAEGFLVSDGEMIRRGGPSRSIGMSEIKRRRVEELEIDCHPGTKVGECVPFYFCPRSIMLYLIHRANHPGLQYRGGQDPIIHLEADLRSVVEWADDCGELWAFSLSNAGAYYAEFRSSLQDLGVLNWQAIQATDFRPESIKEGKQAEFLVRNRMPFDLVERIGVRTRLVERLVEQALERTRHRPLIELLPEWYF